MATKTDRNRQRIWKSAGSILTAFTRNGTSSSWQEMAKVIDHTLLKPDAVRDQVVTLCREAAEYRFACAMVNPVWVGVAYTVNWPAAGSLSA